MESGTSDDLVRIKEDGTRKLSWCAAMSRELGRDLCRCKRYSVKEQNEKETSEKNKHFLKPGKVNANAFFSFSLFLFCFVFKGQNGGY